MFFAPPPTLETEIFSRMPDRFRKPRKTRWADVNRSGMAIDSFLEGPCFDGHGNLYVTDIPFGRIFRVSPEGEWELVSEYDGWPNGMKFRSEGRIYITDYKRGVLQLDVGTGAVSPVIEEYFSEGFKGVNDLVFAANGDLYFTDQGQSGLHSPTGRVFRLSVAGKLECVMSDIPSPNGIVIAKDMSYLLVAVTRAQQIWRAPLHEGTATKVGVFLQLHGGLGGPDGLALSEDGELFVAHTGFGSIWHVSRVAEPLHRIRSCAGISTTNIAFDPRDRHVIYITESQTGSILRARLPVRGEELCMGGVVS